MSRSTDSDQPPALVGVDVGGTFTDFVAFTADGVRTWKRPSTPAGPEIAVLEGLGGARASPAVHGSTVATNALLERRGPRTALITTEGFRDVLVIRRQTRPQLYALEPRRPPHVVARDDVITVRERLDAEGREVIPLEEELGGIVAAARASGAGAFAVSLLYSFLNPEPERRLVAALREAGLDASASHEVNPEYREYERASTTAINAFLRPGMRRYVSALAREIASLRLLHSAGGLTSPELSAELPVTMVLSGPAGGVLGAVAVAKQAGYERAVTFDMGGTSTDVSLADGAPRFRSASEIDGLAINVPMVDVVTIGAGGGSLARLDEGGALVVGPESAGADPGPACYGRGTRPAVSDADLVLGRLRIEQLLAGTLRLDVARAREALAPLGATPEEAAAAVDAVVDGNMARAVRRVSLERGFDPSGFTLVAFGGAGPLHACSVAEATGIRRVLVPRYPGVLSALGMVCAPEAVEVSRGALLRLDGGTGNPGEALAGLARELAAEASARFRAAAGGKPERLSWHADARYAGQAHELRVDVPETTPAAIASAFEEAHECRFGYRTPGVPVELVTLRARGTGPDRPVPVPPAPGGSPVPPSPVRIVDGAGREVPAGLYRRASLRAGEVFAGPAAVIQDDATTFVPPGWWAEVDGFLNLILEAPA
ncbi:MAG: hydantoinase/oxoprolinase family protein [Dehalococcoidia bacterium]